MEGPYTIISGWKSDRGGRPDTVAGNRPAERAGPGKRQEKVVSTVIEDYVPVRLNALRFDVAEVIA